MALHHVVNYMQNAQGINSSSVEVFSRILACYVSSWQAAEDAKRRAQVEKESLYKYKSTLHGDELTEEQRDELAIRKAFPSFEKVTGLQANRKKTIFTPHISDVMGVIVLTSCVCVCLLPL